MRKGKPHISRWSGSAVLQDRGCVSGASDSEDRSLWLSRPSSWEACGSDAAPYPEPSETATASSAAQSPSFRSGDGSRSSGAQTLPTQPLRKNHISSDDLKVLCDSADYFAHRVGREISEASRCLSVEPQDGSSCTEASEFSTQPRAFMARGVPKRGCRAVGKSFSTSSRSRGASAAVKLTDILSNEESRLLPESPWKPRPLYGSEQSPLPCSLLTQAKIRFLLWGFQNVDQRRIEFCLSACNGNLRDTVALLLDDFRSQLNTELVDVLVRDIPHNGGGGDGRDSTAILLALELKREDSKAPWNVRDSTPQFWEKVLLRPLVACESTAINEDGRGGEQPPPFPSHCEEVFPSLPGERVENSQSIVIPPELRSLKIRLLEWLSQEIAQRCFPDLPETAVRDVVHTLQLHRTESLHTCLALCGSDPLAVSEGAGNRLLKWAADLQEAVCQSLCEVYANALPVMAPVSASDPEDSAGKHCSFSRSSARSSLVDAITARFDPSEFAAVTRKACVSPCHGTQTSHSLLDFGTVGETQQHRTEHQKGCCNPPDYSLALQETPFIGNFTRKQQCQDLRDTYDALVCCRSVCLQNAAHAGAKGAWDEVFRASSQCGALTRAVNKAKVEAACHIFRFYNPTLEIPQAAVALASAQAGEGSVAFSNFHNDTTLSSSPSSPSGSQQHTLLPPGFQRSDQGLIAVIDLHMLYVDEALIFLKAFLLSAGSIAATQKAKMRCWHPEGHKNTMCMVHVVTGRGTHSRYRVKGVPPLQRSVQSMLESQTRYRWRPGKPGVFLICL